MKIKIGNLRDSRGRAFLSVKGVPFLIKKNVMECMTLERYDENMQPVYKPKRAFDTQDDAIETAKFVNAQDHVIHKVVPYRCKYCNKYHLGRSGKKLTEKERQRRKIQVREKFKRL